jgi:hypothetical protein
MPARWVREGRVSNSIPRAALIAVFRFTQRAGILYEKSKKPHVVYHFADFGPRASAEFFSKGHGVC